MNQSNNVAEATPNPTASAAPKAPVAPIAVDAGENMPSCAAPAASMPCAAASGDSTKMTKAATWQPIRAPAAVEQGPVPAAAEQVAATEAPASTAEVPQVVIPTVKKPAVAKSERTLPGAKAPIPELESALGHEPELPHAAVPNADAAIAKSMICDSNSVRGRFTGAGHTAGQAERPSPAPPAKAVFRNPPPPEKKTPLPQAAAVPPRPQAVREVKPAGRISKASKPASGVVNAVAQQVGHLPAADPFALEQTVESSPVDPTGNGESHLPPPSDTPGPFHADDAFVVAAPAGLPAADTAVAPEPPREHWPRVRPETWFAIGMGAGLAASFALWLRSRPRKDHVLNG